MRFLKIYPSYRPGRTFTYLTEGCAFIVVFSSTACVLYRIVVNEASVLLVAVCFCGENRRPIIEGVTRLTIVQFQRMRKGERKPAVFSK